MCPCHLRRFAKLHATASLISFFKLEAFQAMWGVFIVLLLVAYSPGLQGLPSLEADADCSSLGEWSTTPFSSGVHGWSRMGYAFHHGAAQPCSSDNFWGDGKGMCYYAACPSGSETNLDEQTAPGYDRADRWPSLCPCKRVEGDALHSFDSQELVADAQQVPADEQQSTPSVLHDEVSVEGEDEGGKWEEGAAPGENASSTGIVAVVSDSNLQGAASQTAGATEASTETPNSTLAEAFPQEADADCSNVGEWSTTPFSSGVHGWSRMGYAFHQGAAQPCSPDNFWGDGRGRCYYAACPAGSETNLDEQTAPGYDRSDRWPSLCPCKRVEGDASHSFDSQELVADAQQIPADVQQSTPSVLHDEVSVEGEEEGGKWEEGAAPGGNASSTGIVTVVSDSNLPDAASQTDGATEAGTETPNSTLAEAYDGAVDSDPSSGKEDAHANTSDYDCGGCANVTYFDAEVTCSAIEQLSQYSSCVSDFCARCGSHSILTSSESPLTEWEDWTNLTRECAMQGYPQITNFDGVNVPLEAVAATEAELSSRGDVVKWIVKSSSVRIQALYASENENGHVRVPYIRAVAVSGTFLNGSVLIVGRAFDPVTWNKRSILKDMPSQYVIPRQIRARRASLATVRDRLKTDRGMEFIFPSSVRLLVNRQLADVHFAIRMPAEASLDGLCGNFNGGEHDDAVNILGDRGALSVKPPESLFSDWLRTAAELEKQRHLRAAP